MPGYAKYGDDWWTSSTISPSLRGPFGQLGPVRRGAGLHCRGLVYANNEHSLAEYYFPAQKARTITVDAAGILEALRHGFGMSRIAAEIARDAAESIVRPPEAAPKTAAAGA